MNFYILLDHILVSGSRFLLSVLVARALGLDDFGIYALLWTIVTLASSMQIPVTITPMMQLRPRLAKHRQTTFFATGLLVQLVYSFIAIPFVTFATLIVVWGRDDAWNIVLAVNAYIIIYNQYEYFRRYFFSKGHYFIALAFDAVLYGVVLAIVLGFLHLGGMSIAVYLGLACLPPALVCTIIFWRYEFAVSDRTAHGSQARRMWRIAKPLIISTLAGFISGHVFVYASAYFLGTTQVGGIAAVRNMLGPLMIILMALENSLIREFVLLKGKPDKMRSYANAVTKQWFFIFLLIVVTLSIFSSTLLRTIYGEDFAQFATLVSWFGGASLIQIISRIQTVQLRTEGKYQAIKNANILTMIVTVIFSPLLILFFGINGAGISVIMIAILLLFFQDALDNDGKIKGWISTILARS